jgi:hypothetical protein
VLKRPELERLCDKELQRHERLVAEFAACRAKVAERLPVLRDTFSANLVAQWESLIYLVDALPLPEEVVPLKRPKPEQKRTSIKRVLRKSSCVSRPPRTWEGLDMSVPFGDWEVADPEQATSKEVESFRTDVHKALFKARQENFDDYKALLQRRAKDCAELVNHLEKEEEHAIWHWDHMLGQLEAPDEVRHFQKGKGKKKSLKGEVKEEEEDE